MGGKEGWSSLISVGITRRVPPQSSTQQHYDEEAYASKEEIAEDPEAWIDLQYYMVRLWPLQIINLYTHPDSD
jgi:hypothetical protein